VAAAVISSVDHLFEIARQRHADSSTDDPRVWLSLDPVHVMPVFRLAGSA
jgi:hypothetical protein